jgi:hypothetical protein
VSEWVTYANVLAIDPDLRQSLLARALVHLLQNARIQRHIDLGVRYILGIQQARGVLDVLLDLEARRHGGVVDNDVAHDVVGWLRGQGNEQEGRGGIEQPRAQGVSEALRSVGSDKAKRACSSSEARTV